jgi:hypothetical protein
VLAISQRNPSFHQRLVVFAVAVLILGAVIADYVRFLPESRMLWQTLTHDRNGHYDSSLKIALALRHGEFLVFMRLLANYHFWLPLNDLTSAAALTVWGPDYRVGMAPALIGFWMTAFFAFLVARRVLVWGGDAAGAIAALLILASPAFRSYAVDIMFESLGAGLTMMTLYFYLVARQQRSARAWRDLGLGLTALFFHKSNYYLIVVIGLLASDLCAYPCTYRDLAANLLQHRDWRDSVKRCLRDPLSYPLLFALAATLGIVLRGPGPLRFGHYTVSVYPPKRPLTIVFALLILRIVARQPPRWWRFPHWRLAPRQLLLWHLIPVTAWFLLPETLAGFLAYVGPWNSPGQSLASRDLLQALNYYAHAFDTFYNAAPWLAFCSVGLFLAAWPLARTWRSAAVSVLILPLLGLAMVAAHPFVENRFIHSFIAVMWVAAACAAISLLDGVTSRLNSASRAMLAIAMVILAGLPLAPHLCSPRFVPSAGFTGAGSLLDLSDAYLPDLARCDRVAMFSTVPEREFPEWTYLERYPRGAFEWPLEGWLSAAQVRSHFDNWIASADAGAIIFFDIDPDSKNYAAIGDYRAYAQVQQMIPLVSDFRIHQQWNFPGRRCSITMWTRQPPAARPRSPNT